MSEFKGVNESFLVFFFFSFFNTAFSCSSKKSSKRRNKKFFFQVSNDPSRMWSRFNHLEDVAKD